MFHPIPNQLEQDIYDIIYKQDGSITIEDIINMFYDIEVEEIIDTLNIMEMRNLIVIDNDVLYIYIKGL